MNQNNTDSIGGLLVHMRTTADLPRLPRGRPLVWKDEEVHGRAYAHDPAKYALCAVAEGVMPGQQMAALFQILCSSRKGLDADARNTLNRVTALLLCLLPADNVITILLALRRARANHKHATRAICTFALGHPAAEEMAAFRRPALLEALEHALGRDVMRGRVRNAVLVQGLDLPSCVRRYVADQVRARTVLGLLLSGARGDGLERKRNNSAYVMAHRPYLRRFNHKRQHPRTVTATNRGDIAATLVHIYRGGQSPALKQGLERYVDRAAASLPRVQSKIALVLDVSASTRGYGEREFCCVSQSVALTLVLGRCCPSLRVFQVGGAGEPPFPGGASDLAGALLGALEGQPDVVGLVTDGYENRLGGDLARVVATLPAAGVATPVVLCHSKFTAKDALALRRPVNGIPEVEFWCEDDFPRVVETLVSHAGGREGAEFLGAKQEGRLEAMEKELKPWTRAR